jgi:hypothetical protein
MPQIIIQQMKQNLFCRARMKFVHCGEKSVRRLISWIADDAEEEECSRPGALRIHFVGDWRVVLQLKTYYFNDESGEAIGAEPSP